MAHRAGQRDRRLRALAGAGHRAILYNLTARTVELEVIPAVQEYGMGLIRVQPAGGRAAGRRALEGRGGPAGSEYMRGEIEENRAKLEPWEALCADLGEGPADVALAWLLHQPAVTAPIIGPAPRSSCWTHARARASQLDDEVLAKLDEIFPGPGGPAPEAYAW